MREGFDPAAVCDPLYVRDSRDGEYYPLDAQAFAAIQTGATRL